MNENDSTLEPELLEAYRGLSTPVSAPADVLAQVEHGIKRRRTARRGLVGVAALAVVGGVGVTVLGGDDGDRGQVAADPGGTDTSTLTFTDASGSTHEFAAQDIGVACSAEGRLYLARNSVLDALSAGTDPEEVPLETPVLYVDLIVDKITPGQVFDLPFDINNRSDKRPMTFFFTSDDGGKRDNELSSAEPGSSGTVTILEASCDPKPVLSLAIDGTVGSEVEQPALAITGEYRS